jgi:hypothetical protein
MARLDDHGLAMLIIAAGIAFGACSGGSGSPSGSGGSSSNGGSGSPSGSGGSSSSGGAVGTGGSATGGATGGTGGSVASGGVVGTGGSGGSEGGAGVGGGASGSGGMAATGGRGDAGIVATPDGSSGGASGGAGGSAGNNAAALETIEVPAGGGSVSFKTSLTNGALYLLKAIGSVPVGNQVQDAEFASAPDGTGAMDIVGAIDVGIDVGLLQIHAPPMGGDKVVLGPGRMKWNGSFRADHTYYMLVTGAGNPLTLKLVTSGTASSGQIAVSLFLLAPTPPATDTPIPGPMPPAAAPPNIGTKVLETVQVPATKTIIKSPQAGESNAVYLLQASGGVPCGGGGTGLGDAEYDDWGATGAGANNDDGPTDFGIGVDEMTTNTGGGLRKNWWGPYRNDHIYFMIYTGTGNPISFLYFDSNYGDNSPTDTLTVGIFPAP